MKALALLLTVAGVATTVHARIGEPLGVLEDKFGTSYTVGADEVDPTQTQVGFDAAGIGALHRNGFEIFAVLDAEKRCRELLYVKATGGVITSNELQGMLLSNSLGMTWKPIELKGKPSIYVRTDGAVAKLTALNRVCLVCPKRAKALGWIDS